MLSEIAVLGGLLWTYCSASCQQKELLKTCDTIEKQLKSCEGCLEAPGPEPVCPLTPKTQNSPKSQESEEPESNSPGKITNNSFFNFMRELRRQKVYKSVRDSALLWSEMPKAEKMNFKAEAYKRQLEKLEDS